ncbi:MAG: hypothetical protein COT85_01955 [Chlamydiae bacterium CG10_big_fil_rev_8_21_14_0_10_42_34]|nr:MAG: hypothetical protein COT85_01955 [Chlamydiae bacterium CG10_big_fil_rev_8_21_14_0_10_42_34]
MENQNPWLSIWTSPRATIARIVAENPNRSLWLLASIYGFCSLMNLYQSMALGAMLNTLGILVLAVVLAPLWGWISFTVWSFFVSFVGKWFKGQATFSAVRASYAWSCVPIVLNIPLWLLMVFIFGHQLFLNFDNSEMLSNGQILFLFAILGIKVILAVWSFVIYLNALAEVQKFSILRSFVNIVVAGIIFLVLFFALWSLLAYAFGGVATSTYLILKPF